MGSFCLSFSILVFLEQFEGMLFHEHKLVVLVPVELAAGLFVLIETYAYLLS